MVKSTILNPGIASLLRRVRHTNTLVIADRGFPFWPQIETIDISLMDNVPTVLQVLQAVLPDYEVGGAWMAQEFLANNSDETRAQFTSAFGAIPVKFEPHIDFKTRVPRAIGLIRTGDTTQYANVILESA